MREDKCECNRTKKREKRGTKTPSTKTMQKRNPMQAIEEVEVKKREIQWQLVEKVRKVRRYGCM